jgi:hypothetical protein
VLTKDGILTLTDVVITDLTRANLLPPSCIIQIFTTFDVAQAKERGYCNQHPTDQFFHLAIELFGCLHKHANVFLYYCANAIQSLKGPKAFIFLP